MIYRLFLLLAFMTLSLAQGASLYADIVLNTASGPAIGGSIIVGDSGWPMHRFAVNSTTQLQAIGGYFQNVSYVGVPAVPRNIFAAIVRLSGPTDFPDSFNLTTPDVIGVTGINIGIATQAYVGLVDMSIGPGWYALQIGTGAFGSPSISQFPSPVEMPNLLTDLDLDQLPIVALQTNNPPVAPGFVEVDMNARFIVTAVPEPSSMALLASAVTGALIATRHGRRKLLSC